MEIAITNHYKNRRWYLFKENLNGVIVTMYIVES